MGSAEKKALIDALHWQLDAGATDLLAADPVDKTKDILKTANDQADPGTVNTEPQDTGNAAPQNGHIPHAATPQKSAPLLGSAEAATKAREITAPLQSREELREALENFDGLAIKKSAANLVFSDGNPEARIMLIGEAPGTDEDQQGKPFVGASGQLLDKILASIGLDRQSTDPTQSVYITNVINWRPPGNRTPNDGEIEVSLPFIEKHIALIKPDILILCGSTATKALLGENRNISKLRGHWHSYRPRTKNIGAPETELPALAIYHPAYLLHNPIQKRAMWNDMLMLKQKRNETASA